MSVHYNYMNPLHIGNAAFKMSNEDHLDDYIKVGKYTVSGMKSFGDAEIRPSSERTGLFLLRRTYKITVIKTDSRLLFHVEGRRDEKLYSWQLDVASTLCEGRIGLRQMCTRSANYSDFKVQVKQDPNAMISLFTVYSP